MPYKKIGKHPRPKVLGKEYQGKIPKNPANNWIHKYITAIDKAAHGTLNQYRLGCRYEPCKEELRASARRRYWRKKAEKESA